MPINTGDIEAAARGDKAALRRVLTNFATAMQRFSDKTGIDPTPSAAVPKGLDAPARSQISVTGANGKFVVTVSPVSSGPMQHEIESSASGRFDDAKSYGISSNTKYEFLDPGVTRTWRVRSRYESSGWSNWSNASAAVASGAMSGAGGGATVTVGTTTTGAAGTDAAVTNSGTASEVVLDFTIPRGDQGDAAIIGRSTVSKTTASLADNATEEGTFALGNSCIIVKVTVSAKCRIRLYPNQTQLIADRSRPIGTDVAAGQPEPLLELALNGGVLTWEVSPQPTVANSTGTGIPYSITNLSGGAAAITATITRIPLEP